MKTKILNSYGQKHNKQNELYFMIVKRTIYCHDDDFELKNLIKFPIYKRTRKFIYTLVVFYIPEPINKENFFVLWWLKPQYEHIRSEQKIQFSLEIITKNIIIKK